MEHPHEPIDVIQGWQEWYKKNRAITQMNEPLISKESRENLHDSSNAVDQMPDWRSFYAELIEDEPKQKTVPKIKEKATNWFADTIAEFCNELTGEELLECFLTAAVINLHHVKKEVEQAQILVDLLRYKNHTTKSGDLNV